MTDILAASADASQRLENSEDAPRQEASLLLTFFAVVLVAAGIVVNSI